MLSLRFTILAAVSAIALWGLFSLLDNLRQPELLRSAKAVIVKGCDPIESPDAMRLCPQLFCQKFLLDARQLPLRAAFDVTIDRRSDQEHLIGGRIGAQHSQSEQRFACILRDNKVAAGRLLDAARLDALSAQTAGWSLDW